MGTALRKNGQDLTIRQTLASISIEAWLAVTAEACGIVSAKCILGALLQESKWEGENCSFKYDRCFFDMYSWHQTRHENGQVSDQADTNLKYYFCRKELFFFKKDLQILRKQLLLFTLFWTNLSVVKTPNKVVFDVFSMSYQQCLIGCVGKQIKLHVYSLHTWHMFPYSL